MPPTRTQNVKRKWEHRRAVIDGGDAITNERIDELKAAHRLRLISLEAPTPYQPGSEEKVAVMGARYSLGLPLHVKGDVNHNESCLVHCTTLPLDRPTFAACEIREVLE